MRCLALFLSQHLIDKVEVTNISRRYTPVCRLMSIHLTNISEMPTYTKHYSESATQRFWVQCPSRDELEKNKADHYRQ